MSFNLDDPLAGILSDGSDDSFFDDDKKIAPKAKVTPSMEKKQALFNLDNDDKPKTPLVQKRIEKVDSFKQGNKGDNPLSGSFLGSNTSIPTTPMKLPMKQFPEQSNILKQTVVESIDKEIKTANKQNTKTINDIFDRPKKDLPKPLQKGRSAQSLLDDILGSSPNTPTKPISRAPSKKSLMTSKSQDLDLGTITGKDDKQKPRETAVTKELSFTKTSNPNVGLVKTKSSDDWLGIFQDKNDSKDIDEGNDMPSWLSGTQKKQNTEESKPQPDLNKKTKLKSTKKDLLPETEPQKKDRIEEFTIQENPFGIENTKGNVAAEGAALCLQEQESQLMIALQLKSQEERLAAIQMRHEESARVHQENAKASRDQVESLLRRQAEQRQQMQAVIAAHQDRITERIKALLGPPKSATEDYNDDAISVKMTENPRDKEKKQLLQLVQSLQENHDKEIDLMETSYRRQLAFLELSLNQAEDRMKEEGEKIAKYYSEKISWFEEHHKLYKKLVDENVSSFTERNKSENDMLRQQHLENIKILQEHHASLMENIKLAVKQEQLLIKDSSEFSTSIHSLLDDVKDTKINCQQLVEKVQLITESTQRESEKSSTAIHIQLNDMMQQLKVEKQNFETEKNDTREIMKSLEARLKQMTMMVDEESANLKQKRMEFEFEKATFNKQTEFAKNILKKQDEEIKAVREDIEKDHKETKLRIDEEKAKAHQDYLEATKEKAAAYNLRQELEKMKSDLHYHLDEVSNERSQLNIEKQKIQMEQQRIYAKSRDLDLLAKAAIEKQTEADKKINEAESIQRKFEERIRQLQEHVVSLNNREKQIAKEKVALSRERLSIHNERKQFQGCSLCKSAYMQPELPPAYTLPESFAHIAVSRDYGGLDASKIAFDGMGIDERYKNVDVNHCDIPEQGNGRFETNNASSSIQDYNMDSKFLMLKLDVQKVLSNLEQHKQSTKNENECAEEILE